MDEPRWAPIAGTAAIVLVAVVSFACAVKLRAFRTDKTALAWLLCAPAIAHLWGALGAQHTWLELALGVIPWYLLVETRLVQLEPVWFRHKRGLVFVMAHLQLCLVFLPLAMVIDTEIFGPVVLLVACVPPTALMLVQSTRHLRRFGHTRDALLSVTAAIWIVHLVPDTHGILAVVHPLVLLRIVWPTERAEYERWFFQVSELSTRGVLALLSVANELTLDEKRCPELEKAWRAVQAWQRCKAKHAPSAEYDRFKREALETLGIETDGDALGPEAVRHRIRQTVHTEFGALLHKPAVQLAVRDWLRTAENAVLPYNNDSEDERQSLLLDDLAPESDAQDAGVAEGAAMAVDLDSEEGARQVAKRLRSELRRQSSSSSSSSAAQSGSERSDSDEVVYGTFDDIVQGRRPMVRE